MTTERTAEEVARILRCQRTNNPSWYDADIKCDCPNCEAYSALTAMRAALEKIAASSETEGYHTRQATALQGIARAALSQKDGGKDAPDLRSTLAQFADAVEKQAFNIRPPCPQTPILVGLVNQVRYILQVVSCFKPRCPK